MLASKYLPGFRSALIVASLASIVVLSGAYIEMHKFSENKFPVTPGSLSGFCNILSSGNNSSERVECNLFISPNQESGQAVYYDKNHRCNNKSYFLGEFHQQVSGDRTVSVRAYPYSYNSKLYDKYCEVRFSSLPE